jgi:four helix bundle protein
MKSENGMKSESGMNSENEKTGNVARSFEDLHIYQRARELTNAVYACTYCATFSKDFGLSDQIRRAAVSIMSNVAEGFERGTVAEFIHFLYIAKGSCGEVRAQLQIALDQSYINLQTYVSLVDLARRTSGMISNFIGRLQSSDYRGAKFRRRQSEGQALFAKWRVAGQAAQAANLQTQARYYQQSPSHPVTPSSPVNP